MKASEIRDMSVEEMNEKLAGLKEELFALRFQLAVNQLDNTARLKAVKKDIARTRLFFVKTKSSRALDSKKGRI